MVWGGACIIRTITVSHKFMPEDHNNIENNQPTSCDPAYTRKEFVALVIKRAGIAGAIICAPKVVDKFFLPPAQARMVRTSTRARTEA